MRFGVITVAFVATANAYTLQPPVLPLIVRTPYLSTWLGNARDEPWQKWPIFWTGAEVGFGVLAHLPKTNEVIPLLGRPHDSLGSDDQTSFAKYTGAHYDASTTNLSYTIPAPRKSGIADDLNITLSFLSPVTPTSTLLQSLPAAYLTVHVEGNSDVNIYVDVNGQWVTGQQESIIEWKHEQRGSKDPVRIWSVKRQREQLFTETFDQAEWGQLLFAAPRTANFESGSATKLRQHFARTGTLRNKIDPEHRAIADDEPVFAFTHSFRMSESTSSKPSSESVTFSIAHIQDPITQYASAEGLKHMAPLWKSWFPDELDLIHAHHTILRDVKRLADSYSDQLRIDAYESGSENYVDIVALSARQIMGATSFSGTIENPLLFLKEISSNGNSQTVDVIFPAFPFFLYTNPRWAANLLEPLLEHQLAGLYPNKYSMHDMGTHFPNLTGHADGKDEYMPVEECGDMLIMGLALVNSLTHEGSDVSQSILPVLRSREISMRSEDDFEPLKALKLQGSIGYLDEPWGGGARGLEEAKKWLGNSYGLWKQWTGYLVEFALEPHNQLCTDDFAGWLPLQTNLALKGIIGIKAFSEIADLLDRTSDAEHYRKIAERYIKHWEKRGISRDGSHAKLAYDWYGSWTTLYSLYADALLCFHPSITDSASDAVEFVPQYSSGGNRDQVPLHVDGTSDARKASLTDFIPSSIYVNQSTWYAAVLQKYGLPLDSRHLYAKSDWEFEAAAVASREVRSEILDRVAKWLNETATDRAFTDLYLTEGDGGFPDPYFFARPVVGGHFAFLALERACGGNGGKAVRRMFGEDGDAS